MATLSQLTEEYLAGPQVLRRAVAGMNREQLQARPVPGKWSTLEVVCHIADFEPVLADRMKRVIAEERPALIGANEKSFAASLAYHDRDLEEELTIVDMTRRQLARILKTLPAEALQRGLDTYPGLPHRLEPVRVLDGVEWINDSKATNVDSVEKSLSAFEPGTAGRCPPSPEGRYFRTI